MLNSLSEKAITLQGLIPKSWVKVIGVAAFAILTAIGAKVKFFLPYTPIPITLQVFFVLFSGAILGSRLGALSQTAYVALGLIGLPVFAGEESGWRYLIGASGGYLIGFIIAAYIVGAIVRWKDTKLQEVLLPFIGYGAGVVAIYALGCSWLWLWANAFNELGWNITTVLQKGAAPFVIIDALKALAAVPTLWMARLIFNQKKGEHHVETD